MIKVNSSMIASAGYNKKSKTLRIKFNSGELYEYYEVEPETFEALLNADSKGKYMRNYIIDSYEYSKIS